MIHIFIVEINSDNDKSTMFLVDMREKKISFINSTNYNSNACQKD